jgi:phosphoserine phosphatase
MMGVIGGKILWPSIAAFVACAMLASGCSRSSDDSRVESNVATVATDPLPSWNDGPVKTAILDFILHTSSPGDPEFVPQPERIAVFDNDGTLWVEQPVYIQLAFAIDRVKVLAPDHPEWRYREPFRSLLAGDTSGALAGGEKAIAQIVMATHAGMTTDEFAEIVKDWVAVASHPTLDRAYVQCVYQPMLELLAYLRERGYKTYIVSGGGIDFMRPWTERVYGIPPEQVIGSEIKTKFEIRKDGTAVLVRLPEVEFIDDKEGKPVGIYRIIGRRPIIAFGNSDGDLQMLQWTAGGPGPRLAAIIHHTDDGREWAYDRESAVGRLDKALDEARTKHWLVVDMRDDWNAVFPTLR